MTPAAKTTSAAAPAEVPAWFPPVEANQGTISIAALALALIAFLLETHRANNATRERVKEFRKALLAVCDDMQTSLNKGDWPQATRMAPRVVSALLNAPPPAPALIAKAVDFSIAVENQQGPAFIVSLTEGFKERQTTFLDEWRKKFKEE